MVKLCSERSEKMKKTNLFFYILTGIFFGVLYALVPMYINVIFIQKLIEYALDNRVYELMTLAFTSAFAIIIAEFLNSIWENIAKPVFKNKIHSDVMTFYVEALNAINLKKLNNECKYNNLKLIEEKAFEQRIEMCDNVIGVILQLSTLISLIIFLATQNFLLTAGIIIYSLIMYIIGKYVNEKKITFQEKKQELITEKHIEINFYMLPEYSEYVKDDDINEKLVNSFELTCDNLMDENKKFFKKIFPINTIVIGGSNIIIEYISLIILGYIKISKNLITAAQFLAYYRAIDVIINGIDFVSAAFNKMHFNYVYLKYEKKELKHDNCNEVEKSVLDFEILELINVTIYIDGKMILEDVSFTVNAKDKISIIGKNASGKTTLLKIISNTLEATSGNIIMNEKEDYTKMNCACYVPAETIYFQWEQLEDDFFDLFKLNSKYNGAIKIIKKAKLFLKHSMLSEGEKKILMIMRAFSTDAKIILLDEPFANLDKNWAKIVQDLIFSSSRTVIFSTHDLHYIEECTATYKIKNNKCILNGGNFDG